MFPHNVKIKMSTFGEHTTVELNLNTARLGVMLFGCKHVSESSETAIGSY